MKPLDDLGKELDALFSVELRAGGFALIVESRGGSTGGRPPRNSEYVPALRQHFERMKALGMVLEDVQVVSGKTVGLPEADRRIFPEGFPLPLALSIVADVESLRLSIGRASAEHRRESPSGGNPTKRLMLLIRWPVAAEMTPVELEELLAGKAGVHQEQPTDDEAELERRARQAEKLIKVASKSAPVPPPPGQKSPRKTSGSTDRYVRDPNVIAWVLCEANGTCEVCEEAAPFVRSDGEPYLEVHHVRRLASGGPDTTDNAVACCPNCHRRFHHASDHEALRHRTISRVSRLKDYPVI